MRAKKFDVTLSNEAKKVARAERFGDSGNSSNAIQTKVVMFVFFVCVFCL